MKLQLKTLVCLAVVAILNGCATAPQEQRRVEVVPLADAACNVTAASFAHIQARHCVAGQGTQFTAGYCTQAALQALCTAVQTAPNANSFRVVQADGQVRYDVNMNPTVYGVGGEKCIRLVTASTANGTVTTMFPENGNAPNPGTCT